MANDIEIVFIITHETEDVNPLPFMNVRRSLESAKAAVERHAADYEDGTGFQWESNGEDGLEDFLAWTYTDAQGAMTWTVYKSILVD